MSEKDLNDIDHLVEYLEELNIAYRDGQPKVDDSAYDQLVEQLRTLQSDHPFLHTVEAETFVDRREVRHPMPMLSTEKAYNDEQLERYIKRVQKEAEQLPLDVVTYKVTPKLDGLAGRDDGSVLASRGNGLVGYDISNAFSKGVVPIGGRGLGLGEIVVVKSYFDQYLSDKFEHPRNMVVGIISSDTINANAEQALSDGVVHFVPYGQLPSWTGDGPALIEQINSISDTLLTDTDYPFDGVVVEVIDEQLKLVMGSTAHHYRWQIAVKRKGETAETIVQAIQWQVGRTGNVTPVMEVAPVPLSGATIRRVTAHNAGLVKKLGIGAGARILIIRSGEVIPKLEQVIEPSTDIELPEICPACEKALIWENDFLKCENVFCPAQKHQQISHWFRTLDNVDWFGNKTIQKLVDNGYDSLEKIYILQVDDFKNMGFGPVQSENLYNALLLSRTKSVDDWRFLAALGIPHLGVGDSRKLLAQYDLEQVWRLTQAEIETIKGFGEKKGVGIIEGMAAIKPTFDYLKTLNFNIVVTNFSSAGVGSHPLAGKYLVFTGKMQSGSREMLQEGARRLGAIVQTSVNSRTNYLVCGEKVGQVKLDKARQAGITILTETEYNQIVEGKDER